MILIVLMHFIHALIALQQEISFLDSSQPHDHKESMPGGKANIEIIKGTGKGRIQYLHHTE